MNTRNLLLASLLVAGMGATACADDEPESTTAVEDAREELCRSGDAYVVELDRYGRLLDDDAVTVGAVTSAGEGLEEASDAAFAALDELDAANEAAGPTETTVPIEDETRDRIESAEDDFAGAVRRIDDEDALLDVGIDVSSAAFQLQVAWQLLLLEVDCLDVTDESLAQFQEYVAALQSDLASLDLYDGAVDGIYGPQTVEAVRALQADADLPETGLLDRPSQAALAERLGDREAAQVAALQGLLIGLGYWPPPADGVWSDALGDALAELQADLGLPPTGTIDSSTLRALQDALAAGGEPSAAPPATDAPAAEPPATPPPGTEPPAAAPPTAAGTVVDVLTADGRFTTLLAAISAADLTGRFTSDQLVTLFAPTDDAFAALPAGELDALLADPAALEQLLLGHTVEQAALLAGFLSQVGAVPSATGTTITFTGPPEDLSVNDVARVVGADIVATNGVVHAIDAVLVATG